MSSVLVRLVRRRSAGTVTRRLFVCSDAWTWRTYDFTEGSESAAMTAARQFARHGYEVVVFEPFGDAQAEKWREIARLEPIDE